MFYDAAVGEAVRKIQRFVIGKLVNSKGRVAFGDGSKFDDRGIIEIQRHNEVSDGMLELAGDHRVRSCFQNAKTWSVFGKCKIGGDGVVLNLAGDIHKTMLQIKPTAGPCFPNSSPTERPDPISFAP